jgi:hypothetical protein
LSREQKSACLTSSLNQPQHSAVCVNHSPPFRSPPFASLSRAYHSIRPATYCHNHNTTPLDPPYWNSVSPHPRKPLHYTLSEHTSAQDPGRSHELSERRPATAHALHSPAIPSLHASPLPSTATHLTSLPVCRPKPPTRIAPSSTTSLAAHTVALGPQMGSLHPLSLDVRPSS